MVPLAIAAIIAQCTWMLGALPGRGRQTPRTKISTLKMNRTVIMAGFARCFPITSEVASTAASGVTAAAMA